MRVAICDDDKVHIVLVRNLLEKYRTPGGEQVVFDIFYNAIDLIAAMKKNDYDAVCLDIVMPGYSGIDAARDIRLNDTSVPIIFLTGSPEYAIDGYRVHAFDYLLKPINQMEFYRTLNHVYALKMGKVNASLQIRSAKNVYAIPYDHLEYVEISKRNLRFHVLDGTVKETIGKLSDYEDLLLSRENFIKVHRSFIINMNNMKSFDKKSFTSITGDIIPIARGEAKEVQDAFLTHLEGKNSYKL